jgi:hypothetical protein
VIPVVAGAVTKKDTAHLFERAYQVRAFHPTTSSPMRWTAGMLPPVSSA